MRFPCLEANTLQSRVLQQKRTHGLLSSKTESIPTCRQPSPAERRQSPDCSRTLVLLLCYKQLRCAPSRPIANASGDMTRCEWSRAARTLKPTLPRSLKVKLRPFDCRRNKICRYRNDTECLSEQPVYSTIKPPVISDFL